MNKHKKVFNLSAENEKIIGDYLKYKTDSKPIERPRNLISSLRSFADYLWQKSLKDATEEDLKYFLNPANERISITSRTYHFSQIKLFYRWVDGVDRHTIPDRLRWYEPLKNKDKKRYLDPEKREKHFITKKDYSKMIKFSNDAYGQDKALWETFYLSGLRPEEMDKLNVGDVKDDSKGHYMIVLREKCSKTMPRQIPLVERPDNLIRWLGNHPDRRNKEAPLWISYRTRKKIKRIDRDAMYRRFEVLKEKGGIKKTLMLKSFRKNRATIMFNQPKKFDDGKMAQFFGWQPYTVAQRRMEYELSNIDDLKRVIWSRPVESISYDTLVKENIELLSYKKKVDKLPEMRKEINDLKKVILYIDSKYDGLLSDWVHLKINIDKILGTKSKGKKIPDDFELTRISDEERIKELIKEADGRPKNIKK